MKLLAKKGFKEEEEKKKEERETEKDGDRERIS